jgi:sugar phosphate isomerase/epimerase
MNHLPSRRDFLYNTSLLAGAALLAPVGLSSAPAEIIARKMKLSLSPGSIGVSATPRQVIALAVQHGFEAVEPSIDFLAGLGDAELADLRGEMKTVVFGAAGLPVDFRGEDDKFQSGLDGLRKRAAALHRVGVDRVGTWISPGHGTLTYEENFKRHAKRLREVAKILGDFGQRLGLEYVGTPTARKSARYPFIHTMRETQKLIAEIGLSNVGLVLDSWHWWTAGETAADILALKAENVISVDLNDAPAGIPVDQQQDGRRELPCATNVIPMAAFVNALNKIGCDAPVRAEPFNKPLNDLPDNEACAASIVALRKAMALLT